MCTVFPLQYVNIRMLYSDLYHWLGLGWYKCSMDGFQMSIKRPTSGGQIRNQEPAVQQTFHLERSSFLLLLLMVRTRCSTYMQLHWTQTLTFALRKWSHAPWKLSIAHNTIPKSLLTSIVHTCRLHQVLLFPMLAHTECWPHDHIRLHFTLLK